MSMIDTRKKTLDFNSRHSQKSNLKAANGANWLIST